METERDIGIAGQERNPDGRQPLRKHDGIDQEFRPSIEAMNGDVIVERTGFLPGKHARHSRNMGAAAEQIDLDEVDVAAENFALLFQILLPSLAAQSFVREAEDLDRGDEPIFTAAASINLQVRLGSLLARILFRDRDHHRFVNVLDDERRHACFLATLRGLAHTPGRPPQHVDVRVDRTFGRLHPDELACLGEIGGRQSWLDRLLNAENQVVLEPPKPARSLQIRVHSGKRRWHATAPLARDLLPIPIVVAVAIPVNQRVSLSLPGSPSERTDVQTTREPMSRPLRPAMMHAENTGSTPANVGRKTWHRVALIPDPSRRWDRVSGEIPRSYRQDMRVDGLIFADDALIEQIKKDQGPEQVVNVATLPGIQKASLAMPDIHWGYGFCIGGVAATDPEEGGVISPGGVGYDINCGVRLLRSDLDWTDVKDRIRPLVDQLFHDIPTGVGQRGRLHLQ